MIDAVEFSCLPLSSGAPQDYRTPALQGLSERRLLKLVNSWEVESQKNKRASTSADAYSKSQNAGVVAMVKVRKTVVRWSWTGTLASS